MMKTWEKEMTYWTKVMNQEIDMDNDKANDRKCDQAYDQEYEMGM